MDERTPGPWQVSPNDAATVTDSKSEFVAYVAVKADGRFIAAAPGLLEAAERAVCDGFCYHIRCERLRAAIAKAKGD